MIKKTTEDYLRAIYHIQEENPGKKGVSSIGISDYLKISKSSVSEMLRKLMKKGLIQHTAYGKIRLTAKGKKESITLTQKHRIIEIFLSETLNLNQKLIHEEAHKLEHAFSNESIIKIKSLLKNPKFCPHGKPVPKLTK
ncbi:MAG TPA: metal-dependent transcriptional regulator [Candidatus Woesearchaeota archaeon]|jgi:DtxR family Mn-dependent transcriptional regulator|nr:metal-dependent transcriptional regulator [Candidatus Woesearchaeota archaeon]HJN56831.1 metal-dependent transcriptional regulator [Candidatus Woesearchaeota archaeon]|tara:strand:+ start:8266 stop:8682 length:417 start_codon:yes stop_codon:yes gene_type:complete